MTFTRDYQEGINQGQAYGYAQGRAQTQAEYEQKIEELLERFGEEFFKADYKSAKREVQEALDKGTKFEELDSELLERFKAGAYATGNEMDLRNLKAKKKEEKDPLSLEGIAGTMYNSITNMALPLVTYGTIAAGTDYLIGEGYSPITDAMFALGAAAGTTNKGKEVAGLAGLAGLTWLASTPILTAYETLVKGVNPSVTDAPTDLALSALVAGGAYALAKTGKHFFWDNAERTKTWAKKTYENIKLKLNQDIERPLTIEEQARKDAFQEAKRLKAEAKEIKRNQRAEVKRLKAEAKEIKRNQRAEVKRLKAEEKRIKAEEKLRQKDENLKARQDALDIKLNEVQDNDNVVSYGDIGLDPK